jgi:hypothetical protein
MSRSGAKYGAVDGIGSDYEIKYGFHVPEATGRREVRRGDP